MLSIKTWRISKYNHKYKKNRIKVLDFKSFVRFIIMTWMFILGVFVGRDVFPLHFETQEAQSQVVQLAQSIMNRSIVEDFEISYSNIDNFEFYNALKEDDIHLLEQEDLKLYQLSLKDLQKNSIYNIMAEKNLRQLVPNLKIDTKVSWQNRETASQNIQTQDIQNQNIQTQNVQTQNVQIRTIPKSENSSLNRKDQKTYSVVNPESEKETRLTLQLAAFKSPGPAIEMVNKLQKNGYPAYSTSINLPQKGVWYRVRVGAFIDKKQARRMSKKLSSKDIYSIIVPYSEDEQGFKIAKEKISQTKS